MAVGKLNDGVFEGVFDGTVAVGLVVTYTGPILGDAVGFELGEVKVGNSVGCVVGENVGIMVGMKVFKHTPVVDPRTYRSDS